MKFSTATKKELQHYVYALIDTTKATTDPRRIFYVGHGKGDRCFAQQKPSVEILRYGLSKEVSIEVEASVIDAIGLENLPGNKVRGHDIDRGRQTASQVERKHGCKPFAVEDFQEPYMLFFINETYKTAMDETASYTPTMDETAIYDCTRQFWYDVSSETRETKPLPYPVALAIVGSVVVRAYSVKEWFQAGTTLSTRTISKSRRKNKWEFVGQVINKHELVGLRLTQGGQPLPAYQRGFKYFKPLP